MNYMLKKINEIDKVQANQAINITKYWSNN